MLIYFLNAISLVLFLYLALNSLYVFVFSVGGLLLPTKKIPSSAKKAKILVLMPCYKSDAIIRETALKAMQHNYPKSAFDVMVIADRVKSETCDFLEKQVDKLIKVEFENSTKVKALNAALNTVKKGEYDLALILDVDNIMLPDFMEQVNAAYQKGYKAIQGHRVAKNTDTAFAILDAISEEVNNHIFRKGISKLGFNCAIIGSGVAFETELLRKKLAESEAVGGFDKELSMKMAKEKIKVPYLANAFVLDEKVQNQNILYNQRRRWIAAQIHYMKIFFPDAIKKLVTQANLGYFVEALQLILLPRVISLALFGIMALVLVIAYYFNVEVPYPGLEAFALLSGAFFVGIMVAIPFKFYRLSTLKAVMKLPIGILAMLMAIVKSKGANQKFIRTPHTNQDA